MMQPQRQPIRPICAVALAALHAGQSAFGYPGYASAVGAFGVGR